ncbi:MAG: phage major tail tube protein [Paracoccaceae bacterium]
MTHVLRKHNAFVEGYSTHLECEDVTPPNIQDQVETIKAGGLIAEYDVTVGLKKLEAKLKLNSRNRLLMGQAGLAPGVHRSITFRGVAVSEIDGTQQDEVMQITGRMNGDAGNWAAQSTAMMEYSIGSILFYRHLVNGSVLHHVDVKNFICIVDGVDQWAGMRSGLGF